MTDPDGGRRGRIRGRAVAQGDSLRHAVRDLRRAGGLRRAQGRRHLGRGARSLRSAVDGSYIVEDLYHTRNMRLAFKDGFYMGGVKAGLMTLTGGASRAARSRCRKSEAPRSAAPPTGRAAVHPDNTLTFSKVDAVFKSGNATRDTIPTHLLVGGTSAPTWRSSTPMSVPRGSTSGGRRAAGQRPELRRLQGDRRAGAALDSAGGGQRTQVSRYVREVP